MGIFGGSKSKTKTKPTLLTQQAAGGIFGALLPWGSGGIQGEKAARAFGGEKYSDSLPPEGTYEDIINSQYAPYRRYTSDYNPYAYFNASPYAGNQMGADILNNSIYGRTAPLNTANMGQAMQNYSGFLGDLYGGSLIPDLTRSLRENFGGYTAEQAHPYFTGMASDAYNTLSAGNPLGMFQALGERALGAIDPNQSSLNVSGQAGQYLDLLGAIAGNTPQAPILPSPNLPLPMLPGRPGIPIPTLPGRPDYDASTYATDMLKSLGGGGSLDEYVKNATAGMKSEYQNTMAEQIANLQSQYAAEGNYLSSPMFSAQGELQADLTSQYLKDFGALQLAAAEEEQNRMYGLAGQGMGTQANYLQNMYGSELGALSDLYGTNVGAMTNMYGNELGALSSMYGANLGATAGMYGDQLGALANMYGSDMSGYNARLGAFSGLMGSALGDITSATNTGQSAYAGLLGNYLSSLMGGASSIYGSNAGLLGSNTNAMINALSGMSNAGTAASASVMNNAMELMQQGMATNFNQAMQMAVLQQQNQQQALQGLQEQYYGPGENLLKVLLPFLGIPLRTESKQSGGGLGDLLGSGGLGGLLGGVSDIGGWLTGPVALA